MNEVEYFLLERYLTGLHGDLEKAVDNLNRNEIAEAARRVDLCAHKIASLRNFLYELRQRIVKEPKEE